MTDMTWPVSRTTGKRRATGLFLENRNDFSLRIYITHSENCQLDFNFFFQVIPRSLKVHNDNNDRRYDDQLLLLLSPRKKLEARF